MNEKTVQTRKEHLSKIILFLPALRAAAKLKQSEVAEAIHISRESYNRIESGKRPLTWKTFLALMAVYEKYEQTKEMISQLNLLPHELLESSSVKVKKTYIVLPTFKEAPEPESKDWMLKRCPNCGQRCWESDHARSTKKLFPKAIIYCEDCFSEKPNREEQNN